MPDLTSSSIVEYGAADRTISYGQESDITSVTPWYPPPYYNRALLLGRLKRYSAAMEMMKRYLAITPNAENARAAQDKIYEWQTEVE